MPHPISILVTGSSGRIGRAVVAELQRRGHRVRGFDRVAATGLEDCIVGDLGNRAVIGEAMRGIECLIHLAATPDDVDDVLGDLVPNNITGHFNVMESARLAGVRRIVLASSGQVNWWQQRRDEVPVRASDLPTPKYWYAATKMFMEAIGHGFAETHGISVIVARLGWCPRTRGQVDEIAGMEWARDLYFSPGDAGRFFACAAEAPESVRHAIVYATSKPLSRARFDISEAKTLLGYEPQEQWPDGVEAVTNDQ